MAWYNYLNPRWWFATPKPGEIANPGQIEANAEFEAWLVKVESELRLRTDAVTIRRMQAADQVVGGWRYVQPLTAIVSVPAIAPMWGMLLTIVHAAGTELDAEGNKIASPWNDPAFAAKQIIANAKWQKNA